MEDYKGIDSKFRLAILAAKRAKRILKGSKKKVDIIAENPLTIALQEMKEGKFDVEMLMGEEELEAQGADRLLGEPTELTEEALIAALSKDDSKEEEVIEAETIDEKTEKEEVIDAKTTDEKTEEDTAETEDGDSNTGEIVPKTE